MTPRERVQAVLNRELPDRTPVDLWLTWEAHQSLRQHCGTGEDDHALWKQLGVDKIHWAGGYQGDPDPNDPLRRDYWGVPMRTAQAGTATYSEILKSPLSEMEEPEEIDDYPYWPDPERIDVAKARAGVEAATAAGFPVMGPWISHFEVYCRMRGLENALMDLIAEPELAEAILDRIDSIQTRILEQLLASCGDLIQMVFISDDMGSQESLLISLPTWQRYFRDRLKRWCEMIHQAGPKVMFHTDGAAEPLIPEFIACGVDVLNPIQHRCPGMERESLKQKYGRDLVFYGAVENQQVLPFGNTDDVRAETRTCLETLGRGGGFICGSCHNIQAGTPVENILALVETVHEHGERVLHL